jgi:hypothetical protein
MNPVSNVSFIPIPFVDDNNNDIRFHHRANDDSYERYYEEGDPSISEKDPESPLGDNDKNALTYRFKFTQEFMDALFQFSKVHQYDDRHSFKEAWKQWSEVNETLFSDEVRRLTNLDYKGNIEEKMYKSARYYYRKKGTEKNAPAERRPYVCSQKELIEAMDVHIQQHMSKPSDGFLDFCQCNLELLKTEVSIMVQIGFKDHQEIREKIKKTYKNRYFLIANNIIKNNKST